MTTNKPRWIAHNTGSMPKRLKPDDLVKVCWANGYINQDQAHWWSWEHKRTPIIAYQIVEETNE